MIAPGLSDVSPATRKVRMGFVGVGCRGTQLLHRFLAFPDVEPVAICDVYEPFLMRNSESFDPKFVAFGLEGRLPVFNGADGALLAPEFRLQEAVKAGSCKRYSDYRRLLEDARVEAVCIAAPDHWHSFMVIDALTAGKDVYCEAPFSATLAEGRAMVNAYKASKQVAAVGLTRRGSASYRKLKAEIDGGKYGSFRVGRAAYVSNMFPNGIGKCPPCQPPNGLDWDKWVGPCAFRPYRYTIAPYFFRWHLDFSSPIATWGVNYFDALRWMMGEIAPSAVTAVGGRYFLDHDGDAPDTVEVTFEFPDKKLVHFSVYEGGTANPVPLREIELQGSDGVAYVDANGFSIVPQVSREFKNPKKPLFREYAFTNDETDGETVLVRDFIDRVKDRGTPLCTFEDAHRSTSFAHLANIALRTGRRLAWDPAAELFTNCPEANEQLRRTFRDGYRLA